MKTVLITGIAGLLGANFAYLLRDRYRVIGVDRNEFVMQGVDSHSGSALDMALMERLLVENKVDVLCHCAALVNVDDCELRPDYAEIVNEQMTHNLALLCKKRSVKMIYISSDAVFSGTKAGLYTEQDETGPISVYGKTKLNGERAVLADAGNLVVRTNIYGFNYRDKNSFGEWIVHALRSDETLQMFDDLHFSPILVNDLVLLLDKCIEKNLCGVYHICGTGSISKYDMGIEIRRVFDLYGTIVATSMRDFTFLAPRTQNMGMDNSAIKRELGVSIPTMRENIATFYALWQQGYGQKLKAGQ